MKIIHKISALVFSAVIAATSIAVGVPVFAATGKTENDYTEQANYFGKRLEDPVSKKFYNILENMDFASGESVKVTDSAVIQSAAAYASGNTSLLDKFGAAVDSFRYDHTEYFYVDFDMLTINVARKSGSLTVEIGAGRTDTYFVEGVTADNVGAMITEYGNLLDTFVDGINVADGATVADKAKAVNTAVSQKVTYDFCNDADKTAAQPYIRTAYGALKYGYAVCEGYSRIYKAALDKLGVTNVLVNGWLSDGDLTEAHMWNNVLDENGAWYGSDPTVADGLGNTDSVIMASDEVMKIDHTVDSVVSSSGYNMPFPQTHSKASESMGKLSLEYTTLDDEPVIIVSYDGLNYQQLIEQQGLYLAARFSTSNQGGEIWGDEEGAETWATFGWYEDAYKNGGMAIKLVETKDGKTYLHYSQSKNIAMLHTQIAVLDADMDLAPFPGTPALKYSNDFFERHVVLTTPKDAIVNSYNDPTYIATPYVMIMDPMGIEIGDDETQVTKTVSVKYTQNLKLKSGDKPVIKFYATTTGREQDKVDVDASVSDCKFDGKDTVTFTFSPTMDYGYNELSYVFNITNMCGVLLDGKDGKSPNQFTMSVNRRPVVCNRVYGDGRLYVKAYGAPTLVSNNDLSVDGWTYTDSKTGEVKRVSQNQRSQLALVVKQPSNKTELENKVKDEIEGNSEITGTYEISMNICKNIASIPDGSYVKLSFGFPAGYGPEDEGVEFEVYHFDKNGNVKEKIPCVITKFGLTVTVHDFSPFVIVAHENADKNAGARGIETIVNGKGGTVTTASNKPVNFVENGGSITYTLTPDSDKYQVEYVMLNDSKIEVSGNTVTLNYEQLKKSNTLVVGYAAKSVIQAEEAAGVQNLNTECLANLKVEYHNVAPNVPSSPAPSGPNVGITVLIVILVIAVVGGACAAVCIVAVKKRQPAKATAGSGKKSGGSKKNKS